MNRFLIFGGMAVVFVSVGFLLKGVTIHPTSFAIGTAASLVSQLFVLSQHVGYLRRGKGSKCWTWSTILSNYISICFATALFAGLFAAAGSVGVDRFQFSDSTSIKTARAVVSIIAGIPSYKYLKEVLSEKTIIYRPEWKRD
eukprot:TRINITY_DN11704_c0_g1_i1.p1 TRINITY_DN11704_c0_g1~~TRINITY_DN11704_c0_g1_i1.p1  ORF type:complete len:142 (+),score=19.13 TRINITY_DN11704_c0_g1_i1:76-501(+)